MGTFLTAFFENEASVWMAGVFLLFGGAADHRAPSVLVGSVGDPDLFGLRPCLVDEDEAPWIEAQLDFCTWRLLSDGRGLAVAQGVRY